MNAREGKEKRPRLDKNPRILLVHPKRSGDCARGGGGPVTFLEPVRGYVGINSSMFSVAIEIGGEGWGCDELVSYREEKAKRGAGAGGARLPPSKSRVRMSGMVGIRFSTLVLRRKFRTPLASSPDRYEPFFEKTEKPCV